MKSLNDIKMNKIGYICIINTNEKLKKRLLNLGFITNTPIKPVLTNPSNDSRAYEIRGSLIAIRNSDAKNIFIWGRSFFVNICKKGPSPNEKITI